MKKLLKQLGMMVCAVALLVGSNIATKAQDDYRVKNGIYISGIDVGGMTAEEAEAAIEAYVESLRDTEITLIAGGGSEVSVTAGDMGLTWENPEVVQEAVGMAQEGNVFWLYLAGVICMVQSAVFFALYTKKRDEFVKKEREHRTGKKTEMNDTKNI